MASAASTGSESQKHSQKAHVTPPDLLGERWHISRSDVGHRWMLCSLSTQSHSI